MPGGNENSVFQPGRRQECFSGKPVYIRFFLGNNGTMNLFDCEGRLLPAREIAAGRCRR